jgi:hypothetical protein
MAYHNDTPRFHGIKSSGSVDCLGLHFATGDVNHKIQNFFSHLFDCLFAGNDSAVLKSMISGIRCASLVLVETFTT